MLASRPAMLASVSEALGDDHPGGSLAEFGSPSIDGQDQLSSQLNVCSNIQSDREHEDRNTEGKLAMELPWTLVITDDIVVC